MNEPYDIFIAAAPKDRNKIKYLLRSIKQYMTGWDVVHISVPSSHYRQFDVSEITSLAWNIPVVMHLDEELFQMDLARVKHRPNWVYQQYLKMFQGVTKDLYFTIDSDVILNRTLPLYSPKGKRNYWMGWEQNSEPYFRFQEKVLNLPRDFPHTGINDTNFFDRQIIHEMLDRNGYSVDSFIEKSYQEIDTSCYPAEPEIWIQYVMKYHSNLYQPIQCVTKCIGKETSSMDFDNISWTDEEIQTQIDLVRHGDWHAIMLHSWWTRNERSTNV